jgi:hypothetical protein
MKLLTITYLYQTTEIKNTKMCPYLTGVQYILLVWLCTHKSSIPFLVSHFIACHDEVMFTLPFKCQKFVTMREQKCKDWQNHRKNSQQNRSGEYVIKEMAPTWQVQVPGSYSFTNTVTSMWESWYMILFQHFMFYQLMYQPFHHVYLKETSFHFSGTILTIKLWSA